MAAEIRGHDQDGVFEVDCPPFARPSGAVVQHLQDDVEDVRVRLLDLVEEDDGVGLPTNRLGELSALLRSRRNRRSPTSRETECFSMYSLMSILMSARSSSKRNSARVLVSSVLPTPVGPRR